MREVFRFWGFQPEDWRRLCGPDRTIRSDRGAGAPPTFGTIRFSDRMLRDFLPEYADALAQGVPSFILGLADGPADGEPMAWLEPGGQALLSLGADGSWRFRFDVDATIDYIQQERYFETKPPTYVRLGLSPEKLPAAVKKAILVGFAASRAVFRNVGQNRAFPSLYKDWSVDVWRFLVRAIAHDLESRPLWPEGKRYAIVLNHDVDTEWGFENDLGIKTFREIEEGLGLRSAWLTVARLHEAGRSVLKDLMDEGHEIGCHGTVHDHKIAYLSPDRARARMEGANAFLREFDCVGFRSPSYHHSDALYAGLDGIMDYDMSMHDCFENDNSPASSLEGCSTCFPFHISGTRVLQIPTTVAEDLVLELAGQEPDQALSTQRQLIQDIAKRYGVANILTHPEPQLSARPPWIAVYRNLLEGLVGDDEAWFALPRDVSDWWKRREADIDALWKAEEKAA